MAVFELRTARGRLLAVGPDGLVCMAPPGPATAVLLCVPAGGPQASFLIAADGRPISVEGDGFAGPAVSARLRRLADGRVELRHPLAPRRLLGVVFGAHGDRPERVLFDRVGDPVLDRLEPRPVPADSLGGQAGALLAELARAVRPPMGADALLGLLEAGHVRLALAETLLRVLPADELAVAASRLMAQPPLLSLLRRAMPADPWLGVAMPGLLAFLQAERPQTARTVSAADEAHVSVLQSGALRPQAGLALTALARATVSPRRVAAVLATARNEGPYLLDWLAHHRALGFDHAVVYANDNDDGSDELLGLLADRGELTWVRNALAPHARAQWKAYGHAFKALPDLVDYRWTMVLDLDEYLTFRPGLFASVAEFAGWHEHQGADAVALRWLNFIAGREDVWHDAPSTARFTRREPGVSPLFKSLVRSSLFWDSHCHFPYATLGRPFDYRLEDGAPCHHAQVVRGEKMPADPVTADQAWVAHHMFRSAAEALAKAARGDATWRADSQDAALRLRTIVSRFVALAAKPGLVTDRRTLECAPGAGAELARLRAIPCVADCDAAIKRGFALRLGQAAQAFIDAPSDPAVPAFAAMRAILIEQLASGGQVACGAASVSASERPLVSGTARRV
jgi:hypothetical protein